MLHILKPYLVIAGAFAGLAVWTAIYWLLLAYTLADWRWLQHSMSWHTDPASLCMYCSGPPYGLLRFVIVMVFIITGTLVFIYSAAAAENALETEA